MTDEIWCPIKGFENIYEVSDQGRVRSMKFGKERILKPKITTDGYLVVCLRINGEQKTYRVHRLVSQTFIPNPDNLPEVNHKDEDKTNNKVSNLEWCDRKYNQNYGTGIQRMAEKNSKPVLQFTKDGEFVKEWKSATDVHRNINYSRCDIYLCCNGKRKSAYNYIWKYKD